MLFFGHEVKILGKLIIRVLATDSIPMWIIYLDKNFCLLSMLKILLTRSLPVYDIFIL